MAVLAGLGLPVLHEPKLEPHNPGGDYEGPWTQGGLDSYRYHADEAAKVMIGAFLWHTQIWPSDRILCLFRAPGQVSASLQRAGLWGDDDANRMNYWRLYAQFLDWLPGKRNPVLFVDGDALAAEPLQQVTRIRDFLGVRAVAPGPAAARIIPRPYPTETGPADPAWRIYQEMRSHL